MVRVNQTVDVATLYRIRIYVDGELVKTDFQIVTIKSRTLIIIPFVVDSYQITNDANKDYCQMRYEITGVPSNNISVYLPGSNLLSN